MKILNYFNINVEHKGILKDINIDELIKNSDGKLKDSLLKLQDYLIEEENINILINGGKEKDIETEETEEKRELKVRIGQDKLRNRVLDNYNNKCALCNIDKKELLICSHIVPWEIDKRNRLNPKNAICLCVLHDKLFDRGYFGINAKYEIIYTKKSDELIKNLMKNTKFKSPKRELPDKRLLEKHLFFIQSL